MIGSLLAEIKAYKEQIGDHFCSLFIRVPGYRYRCLYSIPGAITFSGK
jgi:hypothetical protein